MSRERYQMFDWLLLFHYSNTLWMVLFPCCCTRKFLNPRVRVFSGSAKLKTWIRCTGLTFMTSIQVTEKVHICKEFLNIYDVLAKVFKKPNFFWQNSKRAFRRKTTWSSFINLLIFKHILRLKTGVKWGQTRSDYQHNFSGFRFGF